MRYFSFSLLMASLLMLLPLTSWSFIPNPGDSIDEDLVNWYNLDPKEDKVLGTGVNRAYKELLKDRSPKRKIVVAVIDAGVDIDHEDLQGKIWVNQDEIPGNGVDDDNNGFIDDIHGWNFLGNADGENIEFCNYEFVRVVRDRQSLFEGVTDASQVPDSLKASYEEYQQCLAMYEEERGEMEEMEKSFSAFETQFNWYEDILKRHLDQKRDLSPKDIYGVRSEDREILQAKGFFLYLFDNGFSYDDMRDEKNHMTTALTKHLSLEFNPRTIINDDLESLENPHGNPDVKGVRPSHGTLVAGIIAANRDNELGIDGIASNVEIMALRAVPDGDEYDRDVALSIYYAVDNGADIINLSFGKDFSPQKHLVDQALEYASSRRVLIIHAAGNSGDNLDTVHHFPIKYFGEADSVSNWIVVGANDQKKGKNMAGSFSCYGQHSVDLFAPGVSVVSTQPGNRYSVTSGTSFSCPVVSGVAALVWSYYPELTPVELKEVLLSSVTDMGRKKVYRPANGDDKEKVRFEEMSVTGGIINAYNALQLAEQYASAKRETAGTAD